MLMADKFPIVRVDKIIYYLQFNCIFPVKKVALNFELVKQIQTNAITVCLLIYGYKKTNYKDTMYKTRTLKRQTKTDVREIYNIYMDYFRYVCCLKIDYFTSLCIYAFV